MLPSLARRGSGFDLQNDLALVTPRHGIAEADVRRDVGRIGRTVLAGTGLEVERRTNDEGAPSAEQLVVEADGGTGELRRLVGTAGMSSGAGEEGQCGEDGGGHGGHLKGSVSPGWFTS